MVLLGKANSLGFAQLCRIAHKLTNTRQSHQNPSGYVSIACREALRTVVDVGSCESQWEYGPDPSWAKKLNPVSGNLGSELRSRTWQPPLSNPRCRRRWPVEPRQGWPVAVAVLAVMSGDKRCQL